MKIANRLKLLEEKQRENISIYLHVLIVVSAILSDDISKKKKKVEKPDKGAPSATRYFAFPAVFIVTCVPPSARDRLVSILATMVYGLGPTLPRPPRTHACSRPILISRIYDKRA